MHVNDSCSGAVCPLFLVSFVAAGITKGKKVHFVLLFAFFASCGANSFGQEFPGYLWVSDGYLSDIYRVSIL